MAIYQIENVTFTYPEALNSTLKHIDFDVEHGEFVLLCGASGSGKTTLLRHLKREVAPEGLKEGTILYQEKPLNEIEEKHSIEEIGFVFQNPDSQIVMHTVWQELTFSMENVGYSTDQIERRIGELVPFFGLEGLLQKEIHHLSGGQKQLLNLASVMALQPKVLLLDEPTAQLDPIAAKEFIQILQRLNEELDLTIILSEHRLEEIFPYATKVVMLESGRCTYAGGTASFFKQLWNTKNDSLHNYIPSVTQLFLSKGERMGRIPLTVKEGKQWLRSVLDKKEFRKNGMTSTCNHIVRDDEILLQCEKIYFQYERDEPKVLDGLSFSIQRGEFFTLFGGNGSGKSTFLQIIVGILKQQSGRVKFKGKSLKKISARERSDWIGYVAQNPALYFTKETVREQLEERKNNLIQGQDEKLEELIELFSVRAILNRHPFDLSGGEQQKVVLILALLAEPELLILDEPTKGLDPETKEQLGSNLQKLRSLGTTIFMVSHDIEFAASNTTRCGLLFNGRIVSIENTKNFFQQNYFYTTTLHRTVQDWFPQAVTLKDAVTAWPK